MKLITVLMIAVLLNFTARSQFITSIGTGYEFKNSAIPVQLTAGVEIGSSELSAGYTVFLHKADATIPKILFVRAGLNIGTQDIQVVPLVGAGIITRTSYDKGIYEENIVSTPQSFEILYGLKIQKPIGLGGVFVGAEHCKLSFITAGMFIKIN